MSKPGDTPSLAKPLLVMLALVAAICATGLQLYRQYDRETRQDAQDLVTAVAQQKTQTLEIWLDGRAAAANQLRTAPALRESAEQLITRRDAKAPPRIRQILDPKRWDTQSALLLDVQGAPLVSVGPLSGISAELLARARAVAATGTATMHYLHRDADLPGSPIFLDYLVPLTATEGSANPIAVLVLRHDPERFLFPLIQAWPARSASAETLLVRREGDQVLFLNTLRHQVETALRMTRPRAEATLPAAQAVFGLPRLDKNFDYRGIEVMYDHRPIGGTGWHLIAKIDAAEILHAVGDAGAAALAVTLALILLVGGSAIVYWRQQLRLLAASRRESELERDALSKHLDLMSRYANDSIFLYDEAGRILETNQRAVERYGYSRDELIGMSSSQLRAPGSSREARAAAEQADRVGSGIYETLHRRKDGSEFPVEASLRVIDIDGRRLTQGIVRNITELKRTHKALLEEKNFIGAALDSLPGLFYLIDDQGRFLRWNKNFEKVSGFSAEEISHLAPTDFFSDPDKGIIAERMRQVFLTGEATAEADFVAKDQTRTPYFFTGRRVEIGHKPRLVGMGIDITARKRAEARITRLASLKDALSGINHAIVHADSEQSLFDEICSILVTRAGFDSASIGIADPQTGNVEWAASAGAASNVIPKAHRSVRADRPEGRGPTGTAIREGRHVLCQDFANDPSTAPWRAIGIELGIGSVASFPILRAGKAVGAINVDSRTPNAFDDEAVALLDEAAQDVSFALDNLDREAERERAEEVLRASEVRFRQTFQLAASGIAHIGLDGRFLRVNRKLCEMLGYREEELIGHAVKGLSHPDDRDLTDAQLARVHSREINSASFEKRYLRKGGSVVWVSLTVALARNAAGEPDYEIAVLEDITERKAQQEKIQRLGRVYAMLSGINAAIVRTQDRAELFREACLDHDAAGRLALTYICVVDAAEQRLIPVASAGPDAGFLEGMRNRMSLRDDAPQGYGTAARAVREKRAVVVNDMENDPQIRHKQVHVARGIRAIATLPLFVAGRPAGVLGLHAAEAGFFDEEEMRLLSELAGDLSFALDNFEKAERLKIESAERARAETSVKRLNRVYAVLSGINALIVRVRDRDELFREACRIAVEAGGFRMAWLGMVDQETMNLKPIAWHGAGADYIQMMPLRIGADGLSGRGLSGQVVAQRRAIAVDDMTQDPRILLRKEALERGFHSLVILPLMVAEQAVGVLALYASEIGFFDEEEMKLLHELAGDISFALESLDRERSRRKAKARANELLSIVNRSPVVFIKWNTSDKRPVELVSENIVEFGYSPEEFISGELKYTDIVHPEDRARFIEQRKRAEQEGEPVLLREYRVVTRDGQVRWVEDRTWLQRNAGGEITHYQGLIQDITARRLAETELRAAEEQFRGLVEQSISGIWIIQDRRIVYANPRIAEIFGYASPEELVGRDVLEVVAEKDRALVTENIRRRMDGEVKSIAYTLTGLRKDGAPVEIGGQGTIASFRGRPAIIGVLQDITERKHTEEAAARHLAELQQAMMATVHVASAMGEIRDPYTSGHERRVGELSAAIGTELGLSEHQVEGLRVAGYLHDVGKIMVPSEILSKPGKISPIEFALIKEHAQQGYEILKGVNFPWPVALVALQHHERINGTGYPKGLKGDEILLEARILAVADTVEAMGSHRPYRPGLGIEAALAEIEQQRGTRYDAQAADACLRLFREKGYRLAA